MNNTILGILILVVIVLVGWFAYSQGFFQGAEAEKTEGVEINVGESIVE